MQAAREVSARGREANVFRSCLSSSPSCFTVEHRWQRQSASRRELLLFVVDATGERAGGRGIATGAGDAPDSARQRAALHARSYVIAMREERMPAALREIQWYMERMLLLPCPCDRDTGWKERLRANGRSFVATALQLATPGQDVNRSVVAITDADSWSTCPVIWPHTNGNA
eukprot:scaffold184_cov316-Pinguiococcus_pyrenoidosus.AAC.65